MFMSNCPSYSKKNKKVDVFETQGILMHTRKHKRHRRRLFFFLPRARTSSLLCSSSLPSSFPPVFSSPLLSPSFRSRLQLGGQCERIPSLNLKELKEEKTVQFAAEVTNRFMA